MDLYRSNMLPSVMRYCAPPKRLCQAYCGNPIANSPRPCYKAVMQGIREALEFIGRESRKRNSLIRKLYDGGKGWRISWIADKMGITRQRVQQILGPERKRNS